MVKVLAMLRIRNNNTNSRMFDKADYRPHHQQQHRTRKRQCHRSCGVSMMVTVTVTVTATFIFQSGATLVSSWPTKTACDSDITLCRRVAFQATIRVKREGERLRQRQLRVRPWNNLNHVVNVASRKANTILGESNGEDTRSSLIGQHLRSIDREQEPEKLSPRTSAELAERLAIENSRLKERVKDLEQENQLLHYEVSSRIVLETFEGEGKMRRLAQQKHEQQKYSFYDDDSLLPSLTWTGQDSMPEYSANTDQDIAGMWCDELAEDGACPVEPLISFQEALRDRACWLVGLLILQSGSGIILARNEELLANHAAIVYFLTMLVGAGGNAGNQASVRVVRGLALGTLNEKTQGQFLMREFKMALALSVILAAAGFLRAAIFRTPFPETLAVTAALAMIVFSSVCLGAVLPLLMKKLLIDPAHSSTTIQVVMDILGVALAVVVSSLLLDGPVGQLLISKLGG